MVLRHRQENGADTACREVYSGQRTMASDETTAQTRFCGRQPQAILGNPRVALCKKDYRNPYLGVNPNAGIKGPRHLVHMRFPALAAASRKR